MLRLDTNVELDSGAIATHYIVAIVSVSTDKIELTLDGFVSAEIADKALTQSRILAHQQELSQKLQALLSKEEKTEKDTAEANKLQEEINKLYEELDGVFPYKTFVVDCDVVDIPFTEEVNDEYIYSELIKIDKYKETKVYETK